MQLRPLPTPYPSRQHVGEKADLTSDPQGFSGRIREFGAAAKPKVTHLIAVNFRHPDLSVLVATPPHPVLHAGAAIAAPRTTGMAQVTEYYCFEAAEAPPSQPNAKNIKFSFGGGGPCF
jgi:hypothetical protein